VDFWEIVGATTSGPGRLRFIIQPLIAILLGARDGGHDYAAQRTAFLWGLLTERGERRGRAREAVAAAAFPFLLAIGMDALFQYLILQRVAVAGAVLVGILLIALPYSVSRALANRAWTVVHRRRHAP
jgi:hypothetical protein